MSLSSHPTDRLCEMFPEVQIADTQTGGGLDCAVAICATSEVEAVLKFLRDECGFTMLVDVSAVDFHPREPRFDVNYQMLSMTDGVRIRVKTKVQSETVSIVDSFPTADFQEREIFDMFGVVFTGHPNLTRILMPDDWEGHPLRKDYPIGGVAVEYRIEPAWVTDEPSTIDVGRRSFGGIPPRLGRDRGVKSVWTWTGPPSSGVGTHVARRSEDAEEAP